MLKISAAVEKSRRMRAKDAVPTSRGEPKTCRPAAYNALLVYRAFYPPRWGDSPQTKEWKSDCAGWPEAILINEVLLGMKHDANGALQGPLYPQSPNLEISYARPVVGLAEKSLFMWA
jgi:hypothetical protein